MVKMKNTKNPKRSHNTNFMLGEFSLLPYSVISAKKNKQSIKIHTINNINTITKYKEFKEKKVGNRYYANTMQFYFAFRRGQCRKKKGLEINLNPLLLCFVVVGDERFELPTLYMSSRCSNQLS